jgi:hypothetical protein
MHTSIPEPTLVDELNRQSHELKDAIGQSIGRGIRPAKRWVHDNWLVGTQAAKVASPLTCRRCAATHA